MCKLVSIFLYLKYYWVHINQKHISIAKPSLQNYSGPYVFFYRHSFYIFICIVVYCTSSTHFSRAKINTFCCFHKSKLFFFQVKNKELPNPDHSSLHFCDLLAEIWPGGKLIDLVFEEFYSYGTANHPINQK